MKKIKMFESYGNARDSSVVAPKSFEVEENTDDQPLGDIFRPKRSFLDLLPFDHCCLIFPERQIFFYKLF